MKRHPKESQDKPTVWSAPGVKDIKTPTTRLHELDCTDLYGAVLARRTPTACKTGTGSGRPTSATLTDLQVRGLPTSTAGCRYRGQWFIFEVDRGTKTL